MTGIRSWSRHNRLAPRVTRESERAFSRNWMEPRKEHKSSEAFGAILESVLRIIVIAVPNPNPIPTPPNCSKRGGQDKILKKVAEEAGEVLLAAKGGKRDEIIYEVADLFFHTLMVLGYHEVSLQEVYQELGSRYGKSGLKRQQ